MIDDSQKLPKKKLYYELNNFPKLPKFLNFSKKFKNCRLAENCQKDFEISELHKFSKKTPKLQNSFKQFKNFWIAQKIAKIEKFFQKILEIKKLLNSFKKIHKMPTLAKFLRISELHKIAWLLKIA